MMFRKIVLFVLTVSCILSGCASLTPNYKPLAETDKPEIVVRPFTAKGAKGSHTVDSNFEVLFAQYLAGQLQAKQYKALVVDKNTDSRKYKYVVDGNISQIEAGSAAGRVWIGMGAGAARMTISFNLRRGADKKVLVTDTESNSDLISSDERTCFHRIQKDIAEHFATKIISRIEADKAR
jgi:hypothetical protein